MKFGGGRKFWGLAQYLAVVAVRAGAHNQHLGHLSCPPFHLFSVCCTSHLQWPDATRERYFPLLPPTPFFGSTSTGTHNNRLQEKLATQPLGVSSGWYLRCRQHEWARTGQAGTFFFFSFPLDLGRPFFLPGPNGSPDFLGGCERFGALAGLEVKNNNTAASIQCPGGSD